MTAEQKKAYSKWYRAAFAEKHREYDRQRDRTGRKKLPSPRDPIKQKAKEALWSAINSGLVVRPSSCSECLIETIPQGHHEDYGKPLEVIWLCRPCHSKRHRKYR